jgi:uncharacterized protein YjbI with pentapeptide repeats
MSAVESYRAHLDIEIITGEENAVIALNGRRGRGGPVGVIMTVDAPGAKQRHEMILDESYFYLKNDKQEWVRHSTEDQWEIGASSSWAVDLASSIDFFGNLLPQGEVPWEIYDVRSLGEEAVEDVQVQRLEIQSDFREIWEHVEEPRRNQFILSRILGIAPEELFQQTEADKMELWIDERGYVHQMSIDMVLTGGRSLRVRMRGYNFDENIMVRIPTDDQGVAVEFSSLPSPLESSTVANSESPVESDATRAANPEASMTPDVVPAATPVPTSVSSSIPNTSAQVMTREEVQASLGLGISLHRRNLSGADLSYAHLKGANFQDANLSGVDFYAADLSQADLRGANLAGANLKRADLRLTDLRRAHLTGTDLSELDMEAANLQELQYPGGKFNKSYLPRAILIKANLEGADLNKAFLVEADLTGANLTGADLTNVDLTGANLTNADLSDAKLNGADLTGAKLNGTILFGADLTSTDLTDAKLIGVSLMAADLTSAIVESTFFDRGTTWGRAFCDEVRRCTWSGLTERGALLGG